MENPIKMDDSGGKPTIFGNIHIRSTSTQHFQMFILQVSPKIYLINKFNL